MDHRSDEQRRAQRRALIKATHPDRGGDPDRLIAALAEFDGRTAPAATREQPASREQAAGPDQPPNRFESPRPDLRPRPGTGRRLTVRLRAAVRDLRTALPRGCPGSVRFIDITDRPTAEETS